MPRPPLPSRFANPHVKSTLESGVYPPVKYQVLNCQGQDILVGRMKIETPTPSGHAFILRRYDTGAVSLTTMYRAAFPNAPEQEEKDEVQWVKENHDLTGNNGSSRDTHITRLAGTWVSADLALELGTAYKLDGLITSVIAAHPDPTANYRRSGKTAANTTTPVKVPDSTYNAPSPASATKAPTSSAAAAKPPSKRRKESSPAPVSAPAPKTTMPRRSTRTKSPPLKSSSSSNMQPLMSAVKTPKKNTRRSEVATPGGSDETAVDDEAETLEDVAGNDLHEQDVAEQKEMIANLKAKREAAKRAALEEQQEEEQAEDDEDEEEKAYIKTKSKGKSKRTLEDVEDEDKLRFNFNKEPEVGERALVTNRRTGVRMEPRNKSFAWGVAAFVFGAGAVAFLPNFL